MKSSYFGWLKAIFFFTVLFTFSLGHSQETLEKISLKDYVLELEETFDVRFSFREKDLEKVTVTKTNKVLPLKQLLNLLEQQTQLKFEILNERYIAISLPKKKFNVCGTVKDSKTLAPLVGAIVFTADSSRTTVTDLQGRFVLTEVDRKTHLNISFKGYEEFYSIMVSSLEGENCPGIFLEPIFESLKETVVVNYLTSGISKKLDGSTQIDTERFGTLPGLMEPDALQTVESLPGVESVNETISNINIRGGTSDQNLVLFDEIKMYLTGHFFGLISAFNPNLTTKVDVIKNGSSPELNDGVSGTVSIRSEDEPVKKLSGGAGFNMVSSDAFLQVPVTEKLEMHFSGRRSINDFVDTPTYSNYFSRTFQDSEISLENTENNIKTADFKYYDISLKALYDFSKRQKLRITLIQVNNNLDYIEISDDPSSEPKRESRLGQDNFALGGTWSSQWNEKLKTKTTSYLTRYNLDAANYTVETDQRLLQKNEVLETGLKFHTAYAWLESLSLESGYQFYEVGVSNIEKLNNPFFSSSVKKVIRSHSIYSGLEYSRGRTFLRAGFRLNYLPKFQSFLLEPRLVINQKLGGGFSFKALGEFKSQTTSQIIDLQEDFLGVENRRWVLSDNETYPVLKSKQFSSGFDYKAKGWYVDLMGYYKIVEGIHTSNQGFQDQHEFIKIHGSYTSKGLEFLINKKHGPFNAYLNYTLGHNNYHFGPAGSSEGLTPAEFPNNFDIRHSGSLAANYTYKDLKFSLGGYLRSGKPYTKPVEGKETRKDGNTWVVNYDLPNAETLPSFFRIDFSSSYSTPIYKNTKASFSLGLQNILNRKNIINRYYRVDSKKQQRAVQINNLSLGFTPNFLVRVSF